MVDGTLFMKKFCAFSFLLSAFLAVSASAQMTEKYVRKQQKPNFFIPEGALAQSQPEKVIMPRYGAGISTAKHISYEDNLPKRQTLIYKPKSQENDTPIQDTSTSQQTPVQQTQNSTITSSVPQQAPVEDDTNYQEMYQSYLRDLDSIAETGKPASTATLTDLDAMNSEERIKIDKEFNAQRDVDSEIKKALQ